MDENPLIRPLLGNLGASIRAWEHHPTDDFGNQKEIPENETAAPGGRMKRLAKELGVSEKTIYNWLNKPDKHPIPLRGFLDLCRLIGVNPPSLLPGVAQLQFYGKISNQVFAEQTLLAAEGGIPPGGVKRVVFPLWSSPLLLDPLNRIYAKRGLYRRFALMDDQSPNPAEDANRVSGESDSGYKDERRRMEEFLELRRKRRELFESGHYIMQLVLMRDELQRFVNRQTLFKNCAPDDVMEQLEYILNILRKARYRDKPRLELRLTSSYLRAQYACFQQPDGSDMTILNTNSGYLRIDHPETQAEIRHEFSSLWEGGSYRGLETHSEWISFLERIKGELENDKARREADLTHVGGIDLKKIIKPQ